VKEKLEEAREMQGSPLFAEAEVGVGGHVEQTAGTGEFCLNALWCWDRGPDPAKALGSSVH